MTATTRRSFIGTLGTAAAAVAAAPLVPQAAAPSVPRWPRAAAAYTKASADLVAAYRAPYLEEVRRFVEEHREGFESGELASDPDNWCPGDFEDLVNERFGLRVTVRKPGDGFVYYDGDDDTARAILAVSPNTEKLEDLGEYNSPCYAARDAVIRDSWDLALLRGWIEPYND